MVAPDEKAPQDAKGILRRDKSIFPRTLLSFFAKFLPFLNYFVVIIVIPR